MRSRTRTAGATVAAILLFTGCTGDPEDDEQQRRTPGPGAIPDRVCSDLLPGQEVADLLQAEALTDETRMGPAGGAYLVRCEISTGEREFNVSMSVPAADSGPLSRNRYFNAPEAGPIDAAIHGMVHDGYTWLMTKCQFRDSYQDILVGASVSEARPGRTELAQVLVELTNNWHQAVGCGTESLPVPDRVAPPPPARPVSEASQVCGLVDSEKVTSILGSGRDWRARATPARPAVIETCGLSSPGRGGYDLRFSMSRSPVAKHFPINEEDKPLPGLPGKGWIDATGGDLHGECSGEAVNYRLWLDEEYLGLSTDQVEELFRTFVEAASEREGCPVS